jgi:hypothetical protein
MKRLATAALIWLGVGLGQVCLDDRVDAAEDARALILRFHADSTDPAYGSVDLRDLGADVIRQLWHADPSIAQWQKAFPVFVDDADRPGSDAFPPVLGRYELLPDAVRFTPRYPPTKGLKYRASADLSVLLGDLGHFAPSALIFSLPREPAVPSTVVESIFPSSDALPENLLRFYVHFSAPMQSGRMQDHVVLLGPDGQLVAAAFLGLMTELWDPAMRRLTVLLDPGRIKRGVGPTIELGAPLRQGNRYTLVIREGMSDAEGRPLLKGISKSFRVIAAIREPIDPGRWMVDLPASETRQALVLSFPAPLDHALLSRMIRVVDADQQAVVGRIEIDRQETRWAFTPSSAWLAGPYQLRLDASLEDLSGNTPRAPFDADAGSDIARGSANNPPALAFLLCPDKEPDAFCRHHAAWLAEDMTVYRGDNQDPAFIEKIRKLVSKCQDWPRHIGGR